MKVNILKLENFRNYSQCKFEFDDGVNILYGENAQGKTNVIEALRIFSSARSHRGVRDRDMIKSGESTSEISVEFYSQEREQNSKMTLYSDKLKKLEINGIEQKGVKALLGIFGTVIFSPEDLDLIKGSPDGRRRFLNNGISQIRPKYYGYIKEFKKLNELKNNLLKAENIDENLLDVYNDKIAAVSAKITVHRHRFIEELEKLTDAALRFISSNNERVEIKYLPGFEFEYNLSNSEIYEGYKKEFMRLKESEKQKGVSLSGPHRDDIAFFLNGKDASVFASQGQQRSVITALKLAEYEFMKEVMKEPPLLLLDDIFSELDIKRQEKLMGFLKDKQVIITCTDRDMAGKIRYPGKLFGIKNGNIISISDFR